MNLKWKFTRNPGTFSRVSLDTFGFEICLLWVTMDNADSHVELLSGDVYEGISYPRPIQP